jgi:hypothetical protein
MSKQYDYWHEKTQRKPRYEGEVISNLYCPVGWCPEKHARAIAVWHTIEGKKYLVWQAEAPCLEKTVKQALKSIQYPHVIKSKKIQYPHKR